MGPKGLASCCGLRRRWIEWTWGECECEVVEWAQGECKVDEYGIGVWCWLARKTPVMELVKLRGEDFGIR